MEFKIKCSKEIRISYFIGVSHVHIYLINFIFNNELNHGLCMCLAGAGRDVSEWV